MHRERNPHDDRITPCPKTSTTGARLTNDCFSSRLTCMASLRGWFPSRRSRYGGWRGRPSARVHHGSTSANTGGYTRQACAPAKCRLAGISCPPMPAWARPSPGEARLIIVRSVVRIHPGAITSLQAFLRAPRIHYARSTAGSGNYPAEQPRTAVNHAPRAYMRPANVYARVQARISERRALAGLSCLSSTQTGRRFPPAGDARKAGVEGSNPSVGLTPPPASP